MRQVCRSQAQNQNISPGARFPDAVRICILGQTVVDQLFAAQAGQLEQAAMQGLAQALGRGDGVFLRAACGFWNDRVDDAKPVQKDRAVLLLLLRPNFWQFSAAGGIGFSLIYCGILRAVFWICPGFASGWRSTPPWGLPLFGIPLGEVAWAVSFGLCWTLFAAFVCDLRLERACPSRGVPAGGEPMASDMTPTGGFRSIGTPIPC